MLGKILGLGITTFGRICPLAGANLIRLSVILGGVWSLKEVF
jgi:hypothetical protein